MKLIELLSVISEYTDVIVTNWNDKILAEYNGKNSIPTTYNDSIVLQVSVYNTRTIKIMINLA